MTGARIFVATLFLLLAAAFVGSTGLLINEYKDAGWEAMAIAHSHLFIFYPLFGILALAAYYLPAVVFTDLYWRHIRLRQAALPARRHRSGRAVGRRREAARRRATGPLRDFSEGARRRQG